jgi:hypothetical protein
MKLIPESYYSAPRYMRIGGHIFALFMVVIFYFGKDQFKPLFLIVIALMAFAYLAIQRSKVFVEKDRISMNWAPGKCVLKWNDVKTLKVGRELQTPYRFSIYVIKENGKKAQFPIHGMSKANIRTIIETFGIENVYF